MLALVGANAIWGASAVASKAALVHVPPLTLATLRVAIALAVLWPFVARHGGRPTRGSTTALLGLTGVAFFCLFQNMGLRYASATNTALINGGIPVLTVLLAVVFLGERLSGPRVAGLLLASGGVASLALLDSGAPLRTSAIDMAFPAASAISFATYAVLGRRIFDAGNALAVVAGSTRYGLLLLLPGTVLELLTVGLGPLTPQDVLLLLYLGVACSALAFVLCGYGLARLDAGQGAVFGNLKPLVGVALAVVLLGESLSTEHVVCGTLVLLGVVLTSGTANARDHVPHSPWCKRGIARDQNQSPLRCMRDCPANIGNSTISPLVAPLTGNRSHRAHRDVADTVLVTVVDHDRGGRPSGPCQRYRR
jgi:drug/metabolite transporter (DMT)-like permease